MRQILPNFHIQILNVNWQENLLSINQNHQLVSAPFFFEALRLYERKSKKKKRLSVGNKSFPLLSHYYIEGQQLIIQ
jgi:hypothetical protein